LAQAFSRRIGQISYYLVPVKTGLFLFDGIQSSTTTGVNTPLIKKLSKYIPVVLIFYYSPLIFSKRARIVDGTSAIEASTDKK